MEILDAKTLGEAIRERRVKKGFTQIGFSAQVGITDVYMCQIEAGKHKPSEKLLNKICKLLDLKITVTIE